MSAVTQNPGLYPLADLSDQLNEEWKKALVHSNGTLNKAGLKRNIEANKKIPHGFLQGFKAKYPEFQLPQLNPDATPEATIPVAASPSDEERSSSGGKRKFSWLIHEWVGNTDELNAREADGTLKPLKECTGSFQENGHQIGPGIDVPQGVLAMIQKSWR
ncbi:uncharacterized protein LOC143545206 [Bidens hawaiensis]|uniref:uncharacterized protein LOC143545206 n=1 Tax=Bidens hawaiensis TaxID=980011 RepID=UPI004049D25E